jgi:hypothetical protein
LSHNCCFEPKMVKKEAEAEEEEEEAGAKGSNS